MGKSGSGNQSCCVKMPLLLMSFGIYYSMLLDSSGNSGSESIMAAQRNTTQTWLYNVCLF